MINNTPLGDDIDLLIEKMISLEMQLTKLEQSHTKLLEDIPHLIITIESLFRVLQEKNLITKDDFNLKIEELEKVIDEERVKAFETAKNLVYSRYLTYLLTQSENYGNA